MKCIAHDWQGILVTLLSGVNQAGCGIKKLRPLPLTSAVMRFVNTVGVICRALIAKRLARMLGFDLLAHQAIAKTHYF